MASAFGGAFVVGQVADAVQRRVLPLREMLLKLRRGAERADAVVVAPDEQGRRGDGPNGDIAAERGHVAVPGGDDPQGLPRRCGAGEAGAVWAKVDAGVAAADSHHPPEGDALQRCWDETEGAPDEAAEP